MKACRSLHWRTLVAFHKISVFQPIITRESSLGTKFLKLASSRAFVRFGVFAEPRVFPAVVRFSNGEPTPHRDSHPEPQGIAIKLIGVSGRKLPPGQEDAVTQDFLATSHSVTSTVRNARQFIAFIRASRKPFTLPFTLASATTEDHRPIGNVMRARRVAYLESSALRGHSPEPTPLPL
jgi:hypothetical protein